MRNKLLSLYACCSLLAMPAFADVIPAKGEEQVSELASAENLLVAKETEEESLLVRCPCGQDGKHKHLQKDQEEETLFVRCPCGQDGKHKHLQKDQEEGLLVNADEKTLEELVAQEEEEQHLVSAEKDSEELFHHDNEEEHILACCGTEDEKPLI